MFGRRATVLSMLGVAVISGGAAAPNGCGGRILGNTGRAGQGGRPETAGTGGGAGPGGSAFGEPACVSTVVRAGACAPADQQFCYKTCGPERTGVKSESCV